MAGQEAKRRRGDLLGIVALVGVTALTATGSTASSDYDSTWFKTLRKPRWEPSGAVIGPVWAVIYACTVIAGSLLWRERDKRDLKGLAGLFAVQYLLNYLFTPLLTLRRSLALSTTDSAVLHLVVDAMVIVAWPIRRAAALLLIPYSAWTLFATILSWRVWSLNPERD
ncbi:MAG: tryptophan-rich sensory protein [Chloroflexota bacterium]|nr:tryptophan-rich sensory protein [Chloroflexota bacterium]